MSTYQQLASFVLAAIIVPALHGEAHCPGNAASVPLHLINAYQMVVAVSVNHSGPYNFLLDTGTDATMVDASLAAELHLSATSSAVVVEALGSYTSASVVQSDLLEIGSHAVTNQRIVVFDLQGRPWKHPGFRGVLGQDVLGQFDFLIDNDHNLLCLDETAAMAAHVRGPHTALLIPEGGSAARPLIIEARLSSATRPVRLKLDSGTNVSVLFNTAQYLRLQFLGNPSSPGVGLDGVRKNYAAIPAQSLLIGRSELPNVTFFTLANPPVEVSRTTGYDGLLALSGFRRVFIGQAGFAVFEPW